MNSRNHHYCSYKVLHQRRGLVSKIELWGKRTVVDGQNTQLTPEEKDYVSFEEKERIYRRMVARIGWPGITIWPA